MSNRIIFIGEPEVDADLFAAKARADFPHIDLLATHDREFARQHVANADALIGHAFRFDEDMLLRAQRLRWIQSLSTGTDAILRLASLRAEVTVTSTRGMHGPQMSELVFLQMLALLRDFPRMQRNQAAHAWQRWPQPLLWGTTAVIVGVGAIAEVLAPRCKAFGMTVYGVSGAARKPDGFDEVFGRDQLQHAAALADFLVLIVPYTPQTEKLIDAGVIAAMKPSAYLINVARGGVLDEHALLAALREKRLAGAALDVFRETPLPPDHPLWQEDRIIITPHIGGMSTIYLDQAYPIVRENLRKFLAGEMRAMTNIVTH
ncbi:MAG: D-2-hydroxyacid dehydrogenase [Steroidobacteraceae bacterium]